MVDERNKRFETLYDSTLTDFIKQPHVVIGAGAIGGYIIKILGQIGIKSLTLWDHDDIEEVNIGPQGFYPDDIGKNKVDIRGEEFCRLSHKSKCEINVSKFSKRADHPKNAFWWLCVDDLDAREFIFKIANEVEFHSIIDTRMGGMNYEIYNINKDTYNGTEKYLETIKFAKENPVTEGCTTRSTPHCAMIAASIGINLALSLQAPFSIKGNMMTYEQESKW